MAPPKAIHPVDPGITAAETKRFRRNANGREKGTTPLPSRAISSLLVSSQPSVGEIERQLRMPQPTVAKHLRVLREAGFVESTVDAQRRLYRLKPEPFQEVDAWLAQFRRFWSTHVGALERHLDRMDQSTATKGKTKEKTTGPKPRT
jgi:DNA-binding transcriptional ArsR family regulator